MHMTLADMARTWPDQEWWLALNSGLPIEGYLPAWFIGQLTAGIAPVPGETPPQDAAGVPAAEAMPQAHVADALPPQAPPAPQAPVSEAAPPPMADVAPAPQPPVGEAPPAPLPDAAPNGVHPGPAPHEESFETTVHDGFPPVPAQDAPPSEAVPPAPAEPMPVAPLAAEPVSAEPVPAEPLPAEPLPVEPLPAEPVPAQVAVAPEPAQAPAPPDGPMPLEGPIDVDASPVTLHFTPDAEFTPLDEEERSLADAAARGDRQEFLRILLSVRQIWVPVVEGGDMMLAPGRPGFQWYVDDSSGRPVVPIYTGPGRMRDAMGGHPFVLSDLAKVLRFWPDPALELVINGGTAIGASIPGDRVTPMAEQVDSDAAARLARDFPAQSDAERQMFDVRGDADMVLKVLTDTTVFLPVWSRTPPAVQTRPGDPSFPWSAVPVRGRPSVLAFTSFDWMKAAVGTTGFVMPTFAELVAGWPDADWGVSVNPGTPIELVLSAEQIRVLAASGLGRTAEERPPPPVSAMPLGGAPSGPGAPFRTGEAPAEAVGAPQGPAPSPTGDRPVDAPPGPWAIMQKVVPHPQVVWHLEQAYDRVAGFVHRVQDVVDLNTPKLLYESLGLLRDGSAFHPDDTEVHVIRWPAYRSGLYRIPFGGQTEDALRSWGDRGWVLELPPFGGDGFAPGSAGSIREYKVDSMRLPHGSEMYAIGSDGSERFVARWDADRLVWGDSE
jgi:type III secretion system (T3SS) SseB-like protein